MNDNKENSDDQLPAELKKIQDSNNFKNEFDIPENYFELMQSELELKTMDASNNTSELNVPEEFFTQQQAAILSHIKTMSDDVKVRPMYRRVLPYAIAASMLGIAMFFFWPSVENSSRNTFAEVIQRTELDIDDMEFFAADEDYYDIYMEEADDEMYLDVNLASDSGNVDTLDDIEVVVDAESPVNKNGDRIKPSGMNSAPTWNELSDEDILQYLFEEGDDEFLIDLN